MMRTEAPKEREGRGVENLARTTPELPRTSPLVSCSRYRRARSSWGVCTVGAGDLAPDHSDLRAANLLLGLVDVGNLLAEVEAASFC